MIAKIAAGFLVGAVAATVGAYFAARRIVATPASALTIVVKPPAAPEVAAVAVPAQALKPALKPVVAIKKAEPPAFYLDPRPPAAPDDRSKEPEPEPPVLSAAEVVPEGTPVSFPKIPPPALRTVTIPAGATLWTRLAEPLSTKDRKPGDPFAATLEQELVVDGFVLAERGARVEGRIAESEQAGRVTGLARLSLELIKIHTTDGQSIPVRTSRFVKSGEESKVEDGAKIALGAGLGAAIGAASARGKGAAIGAAAGAAAGAASVALTRGKPAEMKVEARVSFQLLEAVTVTEK